MLYFQQREPLQQKLKSCRVWGSRSASAPFLHQPRWPAWLVKYGQITPPPRAARHGGGPRPAVDRQSRAVACSQLPCINTSSSSRSDCTDMSYGLTWNKSARIVSFACGGGGGCDRGVGRLCPERRQNIHESRWDLDRREPREPLCSRGKPSRARVGPVFVASKSRSLITVPNHWPALPCAIYSFIHFVLTKQNKKTVLVMKK